MYKRPITRREFLKAASVTTAGTVLAACVPPSEQPPVENVVQPTTAELPTTQSLATALPQPTVGGVNKKGGYFVWGIEIEPPGFNPISNDDWYEIWIYGMSNEPLTWGGENFGSDLNPVLAESWEVSEDGLTWTIHLRKGVTWQDGKPFTADDVLFWAAAIQDPATERTEWCRSRFFFGETPHKFEKVDELTIKITTSEPVPSLMGDICVPLIPKHYFVDNKISNAEMLKSKFNTGGELLGTGPFRITDYKRGEAVKMEKYKDYWRGEPYLDGMVFRIVPDKQALLVAAQTGEIDVCCLNPEDVEQLKGSDKVEAKVFDTDGMWHFKLNIDKPYLTDKRTRQALMYALDRQAFVQTMMLGYGKVADSFFTPFVTAYRPLSPAYEFNPDKAKQLLEEVGWKMGTDGIYQAENVEGVAKGTPFKLVIDITEESKVQPSELAQSYWKKIGIDVTLRQIDTNVWDDENYNKDNKKYDVYWSTIGSVGSNGYNYYWLIAPASKRESLTNYYNTKVIDLFNEGKSQKAKAERDKFLDQAVQIVWDELPLLPVFFEATIYAISKRVHMEECPLDASTWVLWHTPEKLWVEQ